MAPDEPGATGNQHGARRVDAPCRRIICAACGANVHGRFARFQWMSSSWWTGGTRIGANIIPGPSQPVSATHFTVPPAREGLRDLGTNAAHR
jgi:hypothetical protein